MKDRHSKMKVSLSPLSLSTSEEVSGSAAPVSATSLREESPAQGKTGPSFTQNSEKKVRFSEDLIQAAHTRRAMGSQDSASSESRRLRSLKVSSAASQQPLENDSPQDQGGGPSAPPVIQQQSSEIECTKKDSSPSPERACSSVQDRSAQPVELAKCNISNTNTGMKWHQCP